MYCNCMYISETISTYIIFKQQNTWQNLVWIGNGSLCAHGDPSMPWMSNTSPASGYWFNEVENRLQYLKLI